MPKEPSLQQKQAIDARGSVLVSAAAGSGKTFVLTERVVGLLCDSKSPCDADRMLVVTFTNAAAAEMRARIEERISEECQKDPSNKRLLRQKILLAYSSVGTIDSFCMDLVRENFYDLQIDPDYTIINDNIFDEWKNAVASEILAERYEEDPVGFSRVLSVIGSSFADDKLKDNMLFIYKNTRSLPEPTEWLRSVPGKYSPDGRNDWYSYAFKLAGEWAEFLYSLTEASHRKMLELTEICKEEFPALVTKFIETDIKNADRCQSLLKAAELGDWDRCVDIIESLETVNRTGIKKMNEGEVMPRMADLINTCHEAISQCKEQLSDFFYSFKAEIDREIADSQSTVEFIADAVIELEKRLFERCREKGVFTFDMVEHMALSVLKSPAGKEIAKRYDWVLVDEYQDINELQSNIFKYLSDGERTLFAVGDVKQSIYGFRHADPRQFLQKKNGFPVYDGENYPAKVILDANYRSRKGICDFVNFTFSRLMTEGINGMDYLDEDMLKAESAFPERSEPDVEFHIITSEDKPDKMNSPRHIAEYIKKAVSEGMTVGRCGEERPVSYKDFAILMRSLGSYINDYITEFERLGIPVLAEKKDFWKNTEIISACGVINAVSNPCNDVALLTFLTAYPGGFTPDDLAAMRSEYAERGGTLYSSLCAMADDGREKAVKAAELLDDLRLASNTLTISGLLSYIYNKLDYINAVRISTHGEGRRGNLLKLLTMAEEFQKGEDTDLASFCAYTERAIKGSNDRSPVEPSGVDAVRIMSIHSSKGLQFPVCIISRCEAQFNYEDIKSHTVLHESYGFANTKFDFDKCVQHQTLPKRVVAHALTRKLIAEEMRLLYVAMTRAVDKLVFVMNEQDVGEKLAKVSGNLSFRNDNKQFHPAAVCDSPSYANWLYLILLCHPDMEHFRQKLGIAFEEKNETMSKVSLNIIDAAEIGFVADAMDEEPALFNVETVAELKKRVDFIYPYEKLLSIAAKTSVSAISGKQERNELTDTPSFLSGTMLTPAQRGTALHKFMQFCDFAACEIDASAEADRLEDMEFISEGERDALDIAAVEAFFRSELYSRIKVSPSVMREQRFLSKLPVSAADPELMCEFPGETIVVQGAADCLFVENGQLVVLDFKTDRVKTADELASRYASQLEIYGRVFSEVYQMPVKEKIIYSFRLGMSVTV